MKSLGDPEMNTATVPADHIEYLRRRPFRFGCSTTIFPADELKALSEYGLWMEALVAGLIQPVTPEQAHFLNVDRELVEPETVCERAWLRLKARREHEQAEKIVPATAQSKDYEIVDWDFDRCWW
jgi:uncharacterized protein YifE (UPF0438 family)